MSTLTVGTIQSNTTLPPVIQNSSNTEIGTFCRAWVTFNGSGTVAINGSFNVSSITDNGTGNYVVNFSNAFSSNNYATVASGGRPGTGPSLVSSPGQFVGQNTGNVGVSTLNTAGSFVDSTFVAIAVFI